MMAGSAVIAPSNPFPGLRPFREDEEHLFFGRESQIDRMVDKLAATRFLAVVGTSGSGKSSLVNCGLRPALRRGLMAGAGTAWRIVQFRPGAKPVEALARTLALDRQLFPGGGVSGMPLEQLIEATLRMSNLGLVDLCEQARVSEGTNLLVIVDQFEELFRYRQIAGLDGRDSRTVSEDAAGLVNLLLAAYAQQQCPIYVVLTMRSDFLGDCAQFYDLPEAINESQYLVPRMTRDERRAAIAGPVHVAGADISPVLLTRLVNDTSDNQDQLSILQHALNRTWARWQNEGGGLGGISVEWYEAIGTMAHALDRHAEKAFHELRTEREWTICEKVFKALTDKGTDARGIRRPTSLERVCAIAGAERREVVEVIDVFRKPSRSFLMPPVPEALAPETIVDISHESLMRVWKRLQGWTEEEAESARMYRRIHDTAALHAGGRAGLWRDPDLQLALDWRAREQPSAEWADLYGGGLSTTLSFIDESKWAQDRAAAEVEFQRRWVQWCVVPGVLVLFALYMWATRSWNAEIAAFADTLVSGVFGAGTLVGRWLAFVLEITLPAGPFVLAGVALVYWGNRAFRAVAFPKIIAQAPDPVARRRAVPAPEPRGEVAPEALGTAYADFRTRALAYVVDWGILFALFMAVAIVAALVDAINWPVQDLLGDDEGEMSDAAAVALYAVLFVLNTLYVAVTMSSRHMATLGMRAAGLVATDARGERLSLRRAIGRQMAILLTYYSLGIGFLVQRFTRRRQTLHDLVARTVVLQSPATGR
jgi:uncharacterized RDD family membrane protein YckC